jgi:hypothetical protein
MVYLQHNQSFIDVRVYRKRMFRKHSSSEKRSVFSSDMTLTGNEPDEDSPLATASVLRQGQEKGSGNKAKI